MATRRLYRIYLRCFISYLVICIHPLMTGARAMSIEGSGSENSIMELSTAAFEESDGGTTLNPFEPGLFEEPSTETTKSVKLETSSMKPMNDNKIDTDWEYWGPHGEHHWEKSFKSCKGKSQSPINIETERIVYLPDMSLSFINYDRELALMKLTNDGHTIRLEPSHLTGKRFQAFVAGSAFFWQTYRFLQLHFHWRNAHSAGSEHAIDGEKFSMEMHMVHQNVKYDRETDTETVLRSPDAFMVIAVFFNETNVHNPALDPIIDHLDKIQEVHESAILEEPIRLDSLLPPPDQWNQFYRYSGSYTTPGCQEVVTWIIFPKILNIDVRQINKFRELIYRVAHHGNESSDRSTIGQKARMLVSHVDEEFIGFYRHIQELGTRRIYAPEGMQPDSVVLARPVVPLLVLSIAATVWFGGFL